MIYDTARYEVKRKRRSSKKQQNNKYKRTSIARDNY